MCGHPAATATTGVSTVLCERNGGEAWHQQS
jgi:hypothetical protein